MYNKSFNKVISLVAAVMLWIYVIGQINPATERKIEKIPINLIWFSFISKLYRCRAAEALAPCIIKP